MWDPDKRLWTKNEHRIIDLIDSDVLALMSTTLLSVTSACFLDSVGETRDGVWETECVYGLRTWSILTGPLTVGPIFCSLHYPTGRLSRWRLPYALSDSEPGIRSWSARVTIPRGEEKIEWGSGPS